MKSVLLSIRPQHVANILNGIKTIEIRKKFPKDYVGWVYIYCTKDKNNLLHKNCADIWWVEDKDFQKKNKRLGIKQQPIYNGKVVARFWCDKVEEIATSQDRFKEFMFYETSLDMEDLLKQSCLDYNELDNYLYGENGYAIHITNLEIFDKPKEISEFRKYCDEHFSWWKNKCLDCKAYTPDPDIEDYCNKNKLALTRAPQSWCFIEIGE